MHWFSKNKSKYHTQKVYISISSISYTNSWLFTATYQGATPAHQFPLGSLFDLGELPFFPTRVRNSTLFFTHPPNFILFPTMSDFPPNLSIRPLTIQDIDQCVELEAKGFPPEERCSREKFNYRLTVAPELCAGLFVREYDYKYNAINLPEVAEKLQKQHQDKDDDDDELPSHSSVLKETLIGHVIATKIASTKITDASMQLPSKETPGSGHIESSRNIGIHSVVIHPDWRGKNLGALLLHDYIQKLSNQDVGDQIVIINKENLIPFYEKIGFNNLGESECKYAGTTWYDMAIDLVATDDL